MSDDMALLSQLANDQLEAEQNVEKSEEALKMAKLRLRDISEGQIPELMDKLQLEQFKTANGLQIVVATQVRASISKENMPKALEWLRERGHEKIVKHVIEVTPKSDGDAISLMRGLLDAGCQVEDKASIHWQTLGGFVREKLEKGEDVPMDLFGVFRQRFSKVKVA